LNKHKTYEHMKPDHVPEDLFIPGNIWGTWGGDPRVDFKKLLGGRDIVFMAEHYHAGHSDQGMWLVASAEGNRQVLLDAETFTSSGVKVFSRLLGGDLVFFPVETDPPLHGKYRNIIAPFFTPPSIAKLKDVITKRVDDMLDELLPKGRCDFTTEFGNLFPASIFLDIVGLPQDRKSEFLDWAHTAMSDPDAQKKRTAMQNIGDYLMEEVLSRRETPRNDLLSHIINSEVFGRPVTPEEATGCAVVLFLGGLDTVATHLSWVFRYLAENQEVQDLLRKEPKKIPEVNEEMFRFFSAVFLTRQALRDVEVAGAMIKKGDIVACCLPMANHDEQDLKDADVLDIDRSKKRHLAFGYGPHICVGMHLARLEMNIVLERWLARVHNIRIDGAYEPTSYVGNVMKLNSVPLTWSLIN